MTAIFRHDHRSEAHDQERRGVRRIRAGTARTIRRARGDRRRSRGNPRRDPATEGKLRSAHPGARAAAAGRRSPNRRRNRVRSRAARRAWRGERARARAGPCCGRRRSAGPSGISAFNPAISAVLQGVYANLSQDPNKYAIHGFVPSGDIAPAKRGFSIAESELALSASVDDKFCGNLIFSLAPDNIDRSRGSLRRVHRAAERLHAEVRALPVRASATSTTSTSTSGISSTRRCRIRRFSAASSRATACSSSGWRPPTRSWSSAGRSATARASPATDRNKNGIGSGAAYVHAGGDIGDEQQLARGAVLSAAAAERSAVRADRRRRQFGAAELLRQEPARDRRLRLEMGAQRQRDGHQLQAAGRVFLAQGKRRSHLRRRWRARPHQHVELLVAPARLVRRRRLPVHAVLAGRRALRPARHRYRRLRRQRHLPRAGRRSIRSGIR